MKKILTILFIAASLTQCGTETTPGSDVLDNGALDVAADTADAVTDATVDANDTRDAATDADSAATDSIEAVDGDFVDVADVEDIPELPIYDEPAVRVLFDLLGPQVETPFPSDHYIDQATGTIKIASGGYNNSSLYLIEADVPAYTRDAALRKGFALYSALTFMTSTAVDATTIPATGADSIAEGSNVRLYRVDGTDLIPQQIWCKAKRFEETKVFNLAQCFPLYRLDPDSTYMFVIMDGLKDADGNAFQRSRGFQQALGLARIESYPPADRLAMLHNTGAAIAAKLALLPDSEKVVSASVFTTGHANLDIEDALKIFRQGQPVPTVTYELDKDGDGNPLIYNGSQVPGCAMPDSDMAWGVRGYFHAPEFRNADGLFERDEAGNFKNFEGEPIRFVLMVPEGEGPFPVVIAQHGVSSTESAMCEFGQELVRRDVAVLRFLWPEHGGSSERGNGTTDFLDVLSPARIGYNFMQSSTEIASAVILLDQLSADMASQRPEGDGLPPLDTGRIGYVGTSLGAIIGLLYLPFSDRIDVMVSNVGGLGMGHLVSKFVDEYFGGIYIGAAVSNLADHIVAPGDGISNADKLFANPPEWASGPKYLLAQEVIGDTVIANTCTEVLARNTGLKLIEPVSVPIEGVESATPDTLTSGLMQYTGASHHEFPGDWGSPVPDTERYQAADYLETALKNGVPAIHVYTPAE